MMMKRFATVIYDEQVLPASVGDNDGIDIVVFPVVNHGGHFTLVAS
jgi:hypothetical protein